MSEHGYGWWQAADGNWYPPEQHPDHDPSNASSYGWWQASDGNSYPPDSHPDYRSSPSPAVADTPATQPPPLPSYAPGVVTVPPSQTVGAGLTPTVIAVLVASLVTVVGSVLPWATIDLGFVSESAGGLDGDGKLTSVLAIATASLAFFSKGRNIGLAIGAVVTALLCALIAAIDLSDIASAFGDGSGLDLGLSVGIGLWLVLGGSLGAAAASIKLMIDSRSS